jgi:DNA-binding XRE family transcriptional regulator
MAGEFIRFWVVKSYFGLFRYGFETARLHALTAQVLKSLHATRAQELRRRLREARENLGITQIDLANRLAKPQSFVSKFETGERRLDVVEYLEVCEAMTLDALELLRGI